MFQPCAESRQGSGGHDNLKGSGRVVELQVDTKTLRNWLRQCEDHHGGNCSVPKWLGNAEQPSSLKVIDVKRKCIVNAPPRCRYLALSYVWGACQTFRSTTVNNVQFRVENGIDKEIVPKTIMDAMKLVLSLGEQYLWVDALCITQDDDKDKAEQITQMDLIYANALLTIIAAGGKDAAAGLPGLSEGTRSVKQGAVRISENWSLMQTLSQGFDAHLQNSTWNSRGWTFQERLLSRRALFFTQDQVYWMCEMATWNEETILEPARPRCQVLSQALGCRDEWDDGDPKFTMEALDTYITQYSTREFTYQSDALDGFSGILRRVAYQENENFHWGLPHTRFDQALTWKYGTKRRKEHCNVHRVPFPSWSWLGWTEFIGAHHVHSDLQERTLRGESSPELVFYKLGTDGKVQEIKAAAAPSNGAQLQTRKPVNDSFEDMRRQWKGTTIVRGPVSIRAKGSDSLTDGSLRSSQLAPEKDKKTYDSLTISQPFNDIGRLVFWTSHASLFTHMTKSGKMYVEINGKDILLDDATGFFTGMTGTNQLLDFIVVSRSFLDSKELKSLNLFVVKWSDRELNVASRIGCCSIHESDWVRADREWKLVILE
ncbi:HET-domain-containing protein [Zopfia rhizophila CBS 207.26]|uniref:HET-domain-containing protein n=1 Tax=Zopfia rhizophila CBS 207.26 TaxID=1314779 RepID=A0A6A6EPH0_9PEZI|nr:HET-domain-containing protein [Zopfia rhizophila CBS 207.26]